MKEDGVGSHHQHSGQNTAQDLRSDEEKQANPDEDCGCFIHGHELANWDALLSFDSASGDRPRRPPSDSLKSLAVLLCCPCLHWLKACHRDMYVSSRHGVCVLQPKVGRLYVQRAQTKKERQAGSDVSVRVRLSGFPRPGRAPQQVQRNQELQQLRR